MALNARQQQLYIHTVDLYAPSALTQNATTHLLDDPTYPASPTYSAVQCYRDAKVEKNAAELVGMTLENNIFTIDEFHFDVAQAINTNWAIKFTTSGHPDEGMWFIAIGQQQVKNWRANKQSLLAKRTVKPKGVT